MQLFNLGSVDTGRQDYRAILRFSVVPSSILAAKDTPMKKRIKRSGTHLPEKIFIKEI